MKPFFFYIFLCFYNHPSIAQLVEWRTEVAVMASILRSLVQFWLGGQLFCKRIIKIIDLFY